MCSSDLVIWRARGSGGTPGAVRTRGGGIRAPGRDSPGSPPTSAPGRGVPDFPTPAHETDANERTGAGAGIRGLLDAEGPAGITATLRDAPGAPGRRGSGTACVMRAQRNTIHPTSHRASPARRNPPALDSRELTWRNASPGDITKTTPPGSGQRGSGRGSARRGTARDGAARREASGGREPRLPPGSGRAGPRRRRAGAIDLRGGELRVLDRAGGEAHRTLDPVGGWGRPRHARADGRAPIGRWYAPRPGCRCAHSPSASRQILRQGVPCPVSSPSWTTSPHSPS